MNNPIVTVRLELALSSSAEALLSRLVDTVLAQSSVPKQDTLAAVERCLMEEEAQDVPLRVREDFVEFASAPATAAVIATPGEETDRVQPASAQTWFRTTPQERELILLRVEHGEKVKDLAAEFGVKSQSIHDVVYRARKERKLAKRSAASITRPASTTPAIAETVAPPPQIVEQAKELRPASPPKAPSTQASATVISGRPPSMPKPSGTPQRPIRQTLNAEMTAFEAKNGVTRLPTIAEIAETGVPTDFINVPVASEWLTANGHTVKKHGSMGYRIDGAVVRASEFVALARHIARNHAVAILAKRKAQ